MANRPAYGNGVAIATHYGTDGTIDKCVFCATTEWSMADAPVRAEVTTCISVGKQMDKVIGDTNYRISAPANAAVGLEFVGVGAGQTVGDIFFFTSPPSYTVSGGVVTVTKMGKAHWLRGTSIASFETSSNAPSDVQRVTFNGDSGAVVGYFVVPPLTDMSI